MELAQTIKTAVATARLTALKAYNPPLQLDVFAGNQPDAGSSTTQDSLVTCTFASQVGTRSSDTITLEWAETSYQVLKTGAPKWGRITDSTGVWVMDAPVGQSGTDVFTFDSQLTQGDHVTPQVTTFSES